MTIDYIYSLLKDSDAGTRIVEVKGRMDRLGKTDVQRQENYRKFVLLDKPYSDIVSEALTKV